MPCLSVSTQQPDESVFPNKTISSHYFADLFDKVIQHRSLPWLMPYSDLRNLVEFILPPEAVVQGIYMLLSIDPLMGSPSLLNLLARYSNIRSSSVARLPYIEYNRDMANRLEELFRSSFINDLCNIATQEYRKPPREMTLSIVNAQRSLGNIFYALLWFALSDSRYASVVVPTIITILRTGIPLFLNVPATGNHLFHSFPLRSIFHRASLSGISLLVPFFEDMKVFQEFVSNMLSCCYYYLPLKLIRDADLVGFQYQIHKQRVTARFTKAKDVGYVTFHDMFHYNEESPVIGDVVNFLSRLITYACNISDDNADSVALVLAWLIDNVSTNCKKRRLPFCLSAIMLLAVNIPNCPPALLKAAAKSRSLRLAKVIAELRDPATSPERIRQIFTARPRAYGRLDELVYSACLLHPNFPDDLKLALLLGYSDKLDNKPYLSARLSQ